MIGELLALWRAAAFAGLSALIALVPVGASAASGPSRSPGINLGAMDTRIVPGDDFWSYANGTWAARTQIPADKTTVGSFITVIDRTSDRLKLLLAQLASTAKMRGPEQRKVGDFYASWMDTTRIDQLGSTPLEPYLRRISEVATVPDLTALFGAAEMPSPLVVGITTDFKNPDSYVAVVDQPDLGLLSRENYMLKDSRHAAYRAAYRAYLRKITDLAGMNLSDTRLDALIALDTALAQAQWPLERVRDPKAIYNPIDRGRLGAIAPQVDWDRFLAARKLGHVSRLVVSEPSYVSAVGTMLATVPLATWKDWVSARFIANHAQFLSAPFDKARFDFIEAALQNVEKPEERWRRGIDLMNSYMGEAVGEQFVERYYPPANDVAMAEMIDDLRAAYSERIRTNQWMDGPTKEAALRKLAAFKSAIGHPKSYVDYSALKVVRGDLFGNVVRAERFAWNLQLSRFAKPVDRDLWALPPQVVDAYYDPTVNRITFPAAILAPPFFDPDADAAANFGAIGATIGHEIGHGFDDEGSQFDGAGKLVNWWTAQSRAAFEARTSRLVDQFNGYEPVPGSHINGKLTLGENIGDLGGVETALLAYHYYLSKHGPATVIHGLTGDQRFFIAYAQFWGMKMRDGTIRQLLVANPHSPARFRVNGIVRNIDAWYKAFGVKPGDRLYLPPAERVRIW